MADEEEPDYYYHSDEFNWPQQPKRSWWQYIVVDKERQQRDYTIREMDVVRPENKKYTVKGKDNPREWAKKSNMGCPTYGNCTMCARSGPAGQACKLCNKKTAGYLCLYINRDERQWIDAQWLAEKLYRDGHWSADSNRKAGFLTSPIKQISSMQLGTWVREFLPEEWRVSKEEREMKCDMYHRELEYELMSGWKGKN
jgi:hypothetical protein